MTRPALLPVTTLILDHTTNSDRTAASSFRKTEYGTLKSLQVTAVHGFTPAKGQLFVSVGAANGSFANENITAILLSGYVTTEDILGDLFDYPLSADEGIWIQSYATSTFTIRISGRILKSF